jgi:hypothetical protein
VADGRFEELGPVQRLQRIVAEVGHLSLDLLDGTALVQDSLDRGHAVGGQRRIADGVEHLSLRTDGSPASDGEQVRRLAFAEVVADGFAGECRIAERTE